MAQRVQFRDKLRYFDEQLQSGNRAEHSVLVAYKNWLPNRKEAIKRLTSLADDLDKCHAKANAGSLLGSTTSVVGGGMFIAGLALAPFTAGLSPFLTTAGFAASAIGSATSVVSSLSEMGITKSFCSDVQLIINNDNKYTNELIAKLEQFDTIRDNLISFIQNAPFTDEELIKLAERATILCKKTAIGKIVLAAICSLIPVVTSVSVQLIKLLNAMGFENSAAILHSLVPTGFGEAVLDAGKQMFRGPAKLAKAVRIGLGVTAGVFLVIDIWTMVSVIDDIDKGSKSKTGKKFREIAESMEKGKYSVENMISQWREDFSPALRR